MRHNSQHQNTHNLTHSLLGITLGKSRAKSGEAQFGAKEFSTFLNHFFQMSGHNSRKEAAKIAAEARWASSEKQERRSVAGFAAAASSPEGLLSPSELTEGSQEGENEERR